MPRPSLPGTTVKLPRTLIVVLLILNVAVLLGQLWPEGAPPFARAVNIVTLVGTIVVLIAWLGRGRT